MIDALLSIVVFACYAAGAVFLFVLSLYILFYGIAFFIMITFPILESIGNGIEKANKKLW